MKEKLSNTGETKLNSPKVWVDQVGTTTIDLLVIFRTQVGPAAHGATTLASQKF